MSLSRKTRLQASTPLAPMSAKKRAALAAAGVANPLSTLAGAPRKPMMRTAAAVKRGRYTPAVPKDTSAALTKRSGGRCEIALSGCTGVATDPAHRLKQGMGGRKGAAKVAADRLSDLMHSCRHCHSHGHANPAEAYRLGLMLREGQVPTQVPVQYRGRMVWLDDAGNVRELVSNGDFGAQYIAYTLPDSHAAEVRPVVGWGCAGEGWPDLTPVVTDGPTSAPESLAFDPARLFAYGPTSEDAVWNLRQRAGSPTLPAQVSAATPTA